MVRVLIILVLAFLLVPQPAHAWGRLGHRLVAALAWDELTPQVRARITELLAGEADPTLPGIANWADELREHDPDLGKRSSRWHYVNIAEDDCHYDAAKHCKGGDCVVEAIRKVRGNFVFTVSVGDRNDEAAARIRSYPEVESVKPDPKTDSLDVQLKDGHEDGSFLPERLVQAGFRLKAFKEKEVNIEDVFMRITKGITS